MRKKLFRTFVLIGFIFNALPLPNIACATRPYGQDPMEDLRDQRAEEHRTQQRAEATALLTDIMNPAEPAGHACGKYLCGTDPVSIKKKLCCFLVIALPIALAATLTCGFTSKHPFGPCGCKERKDFTEWQYANNPLTCCKHSDGWEPAKASDSSRSDADACATLPFT